LVRLISNIKQHFEDIAEWNKRKLLGLLPPSWMVLEEIEAIKKEIEGLMKRFCNSSSLYFAE